VRNLRCQDVEREEQRIHLRQVKKCKSAGEPISDSLAFELRRWLKSGWATWPTAEGGDYLSPADGSERIETNERFNKMIKQATERADIQEIKDESTLTEQQQDMMDAEEDTREWQRVTIHVLHHTHVKHFHDQLLAEGFSFEFSERHFRRKLASCGMNYTKS
jgi:integrase